MSHSTPIFPKTALAVAFGTVCLVLAGCGGGGGAEPASQVSTAAAVTASQPAASAAAASAPAPSSVASLPESGGASSSSFDLPVEPRAPSKFILASGDQPSAPGYYIDSLNGSDGNAGSSTAPWKTLARLAGVRLTAGQGVYLRCGGVWRESLTMGADQLVDGSVVAAYGSDCNASNKPRITGADLFSSGWTKQGNVWQRAVPAGTPKIKALYIDGAAMRTAQWPNYGGIGKEYAIAGAASPSNAAITLSSTDTAVLASKDLSGARAQIRSQPWLIEDRAVASMNASSLKLQTPSEYPVGTGVGYVLQDKLWMLDAPGEFYHDTANGMLYVYPGAAAAQANLNASVVEGSVRSVVLTLSGRSSLIMANLRLDMSTADGLWLHTAQSSIVDGVDALNNLRAGVRVDLSTVPTAPARGVTVLNGRYDGNGDTGIDAGGASGADILSNTVSNTGIAQAAWSHAGIVGGDGARINGNRVDQSAFRAILFSNFGGSAVTNNVISGYCLRMSDCAAIYTTNGNDRKNAPVQQSSVVGNRIGGAVLNVEGTVGGQMLAGIYLDDLSRGVNVFGNLVIGVPVGVYVHNGSNNNVQSNSVWMTTHSALLANMDNASADVMAGNTFRGNQLIPASSVAGVYPALPTISTSQAFRYWHGRRGSESLTSGSDVFVANQVVAFYNDTSVMAAVGHSAGDEELLGANGWKALNPTDGTPSSPAYFDLYKLTLGNELLAGGAFSGGLGGWNAWFSASGGSLGLVNGVAGCVDQCASFRSSAPGDRFSSPNFNMVAGTQYMIKFSATFLGANSISHPDIARPDTPWESYVGSPGLKTKNIIMNGVAGDTISYEAFFTANSSDTARLNFRVGDPRVPVAYDSVSLRPVTGYTISNFGDWGAIVSAPSTASKTVTCADLGWAAGCTAVDIYGQAAQMPLTLAPNELRLLLWANSPWRR